MSDTDEAIIALRASGLGRNKIAKRLGLTTGQVAGKLIRLNAHSPKRRPKTISPSHPAAQFGRTLFPGNVSDPLAATATAPVLKPGAYSTKLGREVTKGAWAGMPIYSLTLEERATCPRSCPEWHSCYGNQLHLAKRYKHGAGLKDQLAEELYGLSSRHPAGFVIRLHVLGDFYSGEYVEAWRYWLGLFPMMRVFGYTAWSPDSQVGHMIGRLRISHNDRFKIRFSGIETLVIDDPGQKPQGAVICPVEQGKTRSCGTCALCWSFDRSIAFLRH